MARRKKAAEPMLDEPDDQPRRSMFSSTQIRSEESPNRVVLPRKVNRPRPGDKQGFRPIVF